MPANTRQCCVRAHSLLRTALTLTSPCHSLTAVIMPQTSCENPARASYQSIFDSALQEYTKKTRKDLSSNPLFPKLQSCGSPDDIIVILRQQIPGFDRSASTSSGDRLTRWLNPTVKVIDAFSVTVGGAVSLVCLTVYEVILHTDIYHVGIPTCRGDLHRHRHPPFSKCLHQFHFPRTYRDVLISLRLQALLARVEANYLTSLTG